MLKAVQSALFQQGKQIQPMQTLQEIAVAEGLDANHWQKQMQQAESKVVKLVQASHQLMANYQAQGYPTLIAKIFTSNAGFAALILRVPLGIILMAHGAQKLFGWFGGYGLKATGNGMASIGFEPGYLMALMAGSAYFFGGLALFVGLLTRPAAVLTAFTMLIEMSHMSVTVFLANNGYEFALILIATSLSLVFQGSGKHSLVNYSYQGLILASLQNRTMHPTRYFSNDWKQASIVFSFIKSIGD